MVKRIASLVVALILSVTVCGTSAFAKSFLGDELKSVEKSATAASSSSNEVKNEKLRTAIEKLVNDAKAGRVAPASRPQIQPRNSNSLSKGTKIAIVVGVVVAVVAIIVVAKADKGPSGPIAIF